MSHEKLKDSHDVSDSELLERFESNDPGAATDLYLRYAKRLFGLVRSQMSPALQHQVEVDDIVQSVFRTFFRRARTGQYEVPAGDELWSLLLVMTLNKIRKSADYHTAQRRDMRRTTVADAELFKRIPSTMDPKNDEAIGMLRIVVDELVNDLPAAKAEMIRCRIAGYEIQEIADTTKRSKRTVERTLQEFRKRLEDELEEAENRDAP
jgi:RNA polymerase sigma-70 factor (ECF subfamily)